MEFIIRLLAVFHVLTHRFPKNPEPERAATTEQPAAAPERTQRWTGQNIIILAQGKVVHGTMCVDGLLRAEHCGGEFAVGAQLFGCMFLVRREGQTRWGVAPDTSHAALGAIATLEQLAMGESQAEQ